MAFDIQSFRKQLRYQTSATAAQLQVNLKQIAQQDQLAEQQKKKYTTVAIACGVLCIPVFFLISVFPPAVILILGLILAAAITGIIASRWGRLDIPNLRYDLPQRLVDLLSRDIERDAHFGMCLDFSTPTHKSKKTGTAPYPARRGWKMDSFEDPWLHLSGHFLDNTEFTLQLTEFTVTRYGWKRGRSGKNKFKRKSKFKGFETQLVLQFPRKKYGAMTLLAADLSQAVKLPPGTLLKQLKADDHQLLLRVKVPAESQILREQSALEGLYQVFTQMLLSAYQGLNLSRELSRVTG
jgi:hypothetical protein